MDEALKVTKTCALAVWSLVLGILSLLCCGMFAGIPAVICGHMAQSRIKNSGGTLGGDGLAIGGLVTGYIGAVLTSIAVLGVLAGLLLPAVAGARNHARSAQDMNNLKQIGMGCAMYAADHEQTFPPNFKAIAQYVGNSPKLFVCPATGKQPGNIASVDEWADYVLVPNRTESEPSTTVLAFTKPECYPSKGGYVLMVDGSVQWCEVEKYNELTAEFRH